MKRLDGQWLLSRRDRLIVARHEVPGSDAERLSSRRDGRSHGQSHRYFVVEAQPRHEQASARSNAPAASETPGTPVEKFRSDGIGSIVPLGRRYFTHDSRHFVPGYDRAVPPGQNHSPIEAPRNCLALMG
jgi:hypothetical protein